MKIVYQNKNGFIVFIYQQIITIVYFWRTFVAFEIKSPTT